MRSGQAIIFCSRSRHQGISASPFTSVWGRAFSSWQRMWLLPDLQPPFLIWGASWKSHAWDGKGVGHCPRWALWPAASESASGKWKGSTDNLQSLLGALILPPRPWGSPVLLAPRRIKIDLQRHFCQHRSPYMWRSVSSPADSFSCPRVGWLPWCSFRIGLSIGRARSLLYSFLVEWLVCYGLLLLLCIL